jgi:hypothetical protein
VRQRVRNRKRWTYAQFINRKKQAVSSPLYSGGYKLQNIEGNIFIYMIHVHKTVCEIYSSALNMKEISTFV